MTGSPSADWTELLVGHVLPDEANLDIVSSASTHFGNVATGFRHYEERMRQSWSGTLTDQEGCTADAGRDAFQRGERTAREIAEKYETIQSSNNSAHTSAGGLRSDLLTIANKGNSKIEEIQNSKDVLPIKVGQITEVVMDCQAQANAKAAACAGDLLTGIQDILDKNGVQMSAQQFANDQGFDTTRMFGSPNEATVRRQVETTLDQFNSQEGAQPLDNPTTPPHVPASPVGNPKTFAGETPGLPPPADSPASPPDGGTPSYSGQAPALLPTGASTAPPQGGTPKYVGQAPGTPTPGQAPTPAGPSSPAPAIPTAGPAPVSTPGMAAPSAPAVSSGGLPAASPTSTSPPLMQSFSQGLQTGTPIGVHALPAATPPAFSEPSAAVTPQVAQTFPSGGHTPVADIPPAATAPPSPSFLPANDPGTAYLAPPPAAPTPISGTPGPVGPLPSYGADIRPPVAATPAAPTAPAGPPAATPSSAPAHPPGGGVGQPAVVRHSGTPATAPTPAGVSEQAVAATTGGALAGQSSAESTARARLQNLLYAVARQQPRLSWAIGDRPDGTTILVTDIAQGWIPPGIEIPTGIQLLDPARRRGNLTALLGEITTATTYTPGQHLPPAHDAEPVPTSPRARHGPVVDELGWELGQATKWRDGLPRLAHTLANAASRETGVLDAEIELLHEYVGKMRDRVLDSYPDALDHDAIENWQLLATIETLVNDDRAEAHYHFAWFQESSRATSEGQQR